MIQLKVRILIGNAYVEATVWAESMRRAVELARHRYPRCDVEVVFPIDPERFFVGSQECTRGRIRLDAPGGSETGAEWRKTGRAMMSLAGAARRGNAR